MTRIAMTDMRLSGDGHSNIRCADALLDFDNYPDIAPDSFDIVLTNPPFGSLLGPEALAQLGTFELARGRKSVALEILGLERAIAFLRPGGGSPLSCLRAYSALISLLTSGNGCERKSRCGRL